MTSVANFSKVYSRHANCACVYVLVRLLYGILEGVKGVPPLSLYIYMYICIYVIAVFDLYIHILMYVYRELEAAPAPMHQAVAVVGVVVK